MRFLGASRFGEAPGYFDRHTNGLHQNLHHEVITIWKRNLHLHLHKKKKSTFICVRVQRDLWHDTLFLSQGPPLVLLRLCDLLVWPMSRFLSTITSMQSESQLMDQCLHFHWPFWVLNVTKRSKNQIICKHVKPSLSLWTLESTRNISTP